MIRQYQQIGYWLTLLLYGGVYEIHDTLVCSDTLEVDEEDSTEGEAFLIQVLAR